MSNMAYYRPGEEKILKFTEESHHSKLLTNICKFMRNTSFTDIKVVLQQKTFNLHKIILASASQYFQILLSSIDSDRITLKNIKENVFEKVVQYIYTGDVEVRSGMLSDLCAAAHQLQIKPLAVWCSDMLQNNINKDNCVHVLEQAIKQDLKDIEDKCENFIIDNFTEICQVEDFVEIPFQTMCNVLKPDNLKCDSELQVYKAFRQWLENNDEYRLQAKDMMKHIRFALIPIEDNNKICREDDLLVDEDRARLVHKATQFQGDVKHQPILAGNFSRPRAPQSLIVIGGATSSDLKKLESEPHCIKDTVQVLSFENAKLKKRSFMTSLPCRRMWAASVTFNNFLFLFGGSSLVLDSYDVVENTVFRYNPLGREWMVMAPMLVGVRNMAASIVDNTIYITGGWKSDMNITDIVQCYNIATDTWTGEDKFPYPIGAPACCTIEDFLYVSGGLTTRTQPTKTKHIFKRKPTIGWIQCGRMMQERYNHEMTTDGSAAFILGGMDSEDSLLASVERFDPATGQTTLLAAMPSPRTSISGVYHNGRIFIPGGSADKTGDQKDAETSSTIFIYNIADNHWVLSQTRLPLPVEDACCALLTLPQD